MPRKEFTTRMMTDHYEFGTERLKDALTASATSVIDPDDLEDLWEDVVDDGSEWALLVTQEQLPWFAAAILDIPQGPDPRHRAGLDEARSRLDSHDGCDAVLTSLTARRDDVVASMISARSYLFNDIYPSEYGDLLVEVQPLLDHLRPRMRIEKPRRGLLAPDGCDWCGPAFLHDDDCPIEERELELDERRTHLIRTHLYCHSLGEALIAHTERCLDRLEGVAAAIQRHTFHTSRSRVVRPQDVLPSIRIEDLNVPVDSEDPTTLGVAIYPELRDVDYCQDEAHTSPHRACLHLVT